MKKILVIFVVAFSLGNLPSARAQSNDILILDLGSISPGESTVIGGRENRGYRAIRLMNIIPEEEYKVEIEQGIISIDPLNFPGFPSTNNLMVGCPKLDDQQKVLLRLYEEENYRITRQISEKIVKEETQKLSRLVRECTDDSAITMAKTTLLLFERDKREEVRVQTGEKVTITVTRDDKVWKFILEGKRQGSWITTYGFSFLFSDLGKENFISVPIENSAGYMIKKRNNRDHGDLEYIPAVFFSYFPSYNASRWLNHSVTGGLGFDGASPVVMFGYSVIYKYNIGLSVGAAFHQQQGLKGEYQENEVISTDLSFDQLHDPVYRPNLYFSIQFRLGQNPFKAENDLIENNNN